MPNIELFAHLRIIMYSCFDLSLSSSVTAENVKILKIQGVGALWGERRQYAFCTCTHIAKVMQLDPGPVSVVMSPQWTALLKSPFLLDNIWA